MIYKGTGYSTLDDLEARLDKAVDDGIISEQEAWYEMQDAAAQERYEEEMNEYLMESLMEEEPYLF